MSTERQELWGYLVQSLCPERPPCSSFFPNRGNLLSGIVKPQSHTGSVPGVAAAILKWFWTSNFTFAFPDSYKLHLGPAHTLGAAACSFINIFLPHTSPPFFCFCLWNLNLEDSIPQSIPYLQRAGFYFFTDPASLFFVPLSFDLWFIAIMCSMLY